jgi:CoA-transferase family III
MAALTLPLADCADHLLKRLAQATGSAAIADLDGATLLGERAMLFRFRIPGRTSSGGGCHLYEARDGVIALNLARQADRELLPALLECELPELRDAAAIAAAIARCDAAALVARGRLMGLAIAAELEAVPVTGNACITLSSGRPAATPRRAAPRVIDLSALWAGPLAAHLLWLAGAEVIKVESRARPDRLRDSDQSFHDLLNQGKALLPLDFNAGADRALLRSLLADADIVIEASRPRALLQLGIDAEQLVCASPGLCWITITAHGARGAVADWVGFGDDCGVAAGLSAALRAATGHCGFVGDASADPLTGLRAALAAWQQWQSRCGARLGIAMTAVVAECLAEAQRADPATLNANLGAWAAAAGEYYPGVRRRDIGRLVRFNRVDQTPAQGGGGIDPAAGQHQ